MKQKLNKKVQKKKLKWKKQGEVRRERSRKIKKRTRKDHDVLGAVQSHIDMGIRRTVM